MFERKDAARWAKWKFYPGAITIMLPRLIFALVTGLICTMLVSILLIGHKID
jgi:hypothetical protein